jgi:hypothetical protein
MATQAEIRRAILWGEYYLDNLTEKVNWGGRRITLLKSFPSIPIYVWNKARKLWVIPGALTFYVPGVTEGVMINAVLMPLWKVTAEYARIWYWFLTSRGEPAEEGQEVFYWDSPMLWATFEVVGQDIQITLEWDETADPVIVYLAGQKVWEVEAYKNPPDPVKTYLFPRGRGLRSATYVADFDLFQWALYRWYHRPSLRDVETFKLFDDLGWNYSPYYPLYRGTDSFPDTWITDIDSNLKIQKIIHSYIKEWKNLHPVFPVLPFGGPPLYGMPASPDEPTYFFPYISGRVLCTKELEWASKCRRPFDSLVAMRAIHIMNKYGSPYAKDDLGNSAYDYLLKGYKDDLGNSHEPISAHIDSKGYRPDPSCPHYFSPMYVLPAFAELGYGFGDGEAQKIADFLADCLIKSQWGYQTGFSDATYRTEDYGVVNRPDHLGGFIKCWNVYEGEEREYAQVTPTAAIESIIEIEPFVYFPFNKEQMIFTPTYAEWTLGALHALRIYEAYKYRL